MNGLDATLQHLEMIADRRKKLLENQIEAEEQLLHRAGLLYRSGDLDLDGLCELYNRYKDVDPGRPRSALWNQNIAIPWNQMPHVARLRPNGPAGTWVGGCPLGSDESAPRRGQCVVYVLYGDDNEPCYVGSTQDLRARLKGHVSTGKVFARWQAYPCDDREAAYQLEERLLREHMPPLNRRMGR